MADNQVKFAHMLLSLPRQTTTVFDSIVIQEIVGCDEALEVITTKAPAQQFLDCNIRGLIEDMRAVVAAAKAVVITHMRQTLGTAVAGMRGLMPGPEWSAHLLDMEDLPWIKANVLESPHHMALAKTTQALANNLNLCKVAFTEWSSGDADYTSALAAVEKARALLAAASVYDLILVRGEGMRPMQKAAASRELIKLLKRQGVDLVEPLAGRLKAFGLRI